MDENNSNIEDKEEYEKNEQLAENIEKNVDIIVIARVNAKGKAYKEIESAFLHLAKMHRIIKEMV